jgi:hypothetical protein
VLLRLGDASTQLRPPNGVVKFTKKG